MWHINNGIGVWKYIKYFFNKNKILMHIVWYILILIANHVIIECKILYIFCILFFFVYKANTVFNNLIVLCIITSFHKHIVLYFFFYQN